MADFPWLSYEARQLHSKRTMTFAEEDPAMVDASPAAVAELTAAGFLDDEGDMTPEGELYRLWLVSGPEVMPGFIQRRCDIPDAHQPSFGRPGERGEQLPER